jgi:hypothetical protein
METMLMDAAARHVFHAQESAPTWRIMLCENRRRFSGDCVRHPNSH